MKKHQTCSWFIKKDQVATSGKEKNHQAGGLEKGIIKALIF